MTSTDFQIHIRIKGKDSFFQSLHPTNLLKPTGMQVCKVSACGRKWGQNPLPSQYTISIQTISKWRDKYGFGFQKNEIDSNEVKELKRLVSEYEAALGEMALQNHVLKKMQEFALARERKKNSSGVISQSLLGSKRVAR